MDVKTSAKRFDQAVSCLSPRLGERLLALNEEAKAGAFEVRLRVMRPVMLTSADGLWFLDGASKLRNVPCGGYTVTPADIADCVAHLCGHSLHTHQHEFLGGFISLSGGHRAGVCGTAVTREDSGGAITAVREITSINLRVAREVNGAADAIVETILKDRLCGLLIAGPPSSGKTTILRDLARQLASGKAGGYVKVAVVDERGELGAVVDGVPQNDMGYSCDILSGYPKAQGILTAVRTLSPQIIICDEIGGMDEALGIIDSLNAGVRVIASAHAGSFSELLKRPALVRLLENGAFEKAVLLGGPEKAGVVRRYVEVGELLAKTVRNGPYRTLRIAGGLEHGARPVDKNAAFGRGDPAVSLSARQT